MYGMLLLPSRRTLALWEVRGSRCNYGYVYSHSILNHVTNSTRWWICRVLRISCRQGVQDKSSKRCRCDVTWTGVMCSARSWQDCSEAWVVSTHVWSWTYRSCFVPNAKTERRLQCGCCSTARSKDGIGKETWCRRCKHSIQGHWPSLTVFTEIYWTVTWESRSTVPEDQGRQPIRLRYCCWGNWIT